MSSYKDHQLHAMKCNEPAVWSATCFNQPANLQKILELRARSWVFLKLQLYLVGPHNIQLTHTSKHQNSTRYGKFWRLHLLDPAMMCQNGRNYDPTSTRLGVCVLSAEAHSPSNPGMAYVSCKAFFLALLGINHGHWNLNSCLWFPVRNTCAVEQHQLQLMLRSATLMMSHRLCCCVWTEAVKVSSCCESTLHRSETLCQGLCNWLPRLQGIAWQCKQTCDEQHRTACLAVLLLLQL